jgi:DNA-binding transcriptional LysR family regulator
MWWKDLHYLDALQRTGTMTGAARELRVNKATVSRRLAELERATPAALFERRNDKIELTAYGARALRAFRAHERSERVLVAELERIQEGTRGSVLITMPTFLACTLMIPAIDAARQSHSEIDVGIHCGNQLLDLTRAEADIALRNIRPTAGGLDVRKVARVGIATFASRSYLARRGQLLAAHDLTGHDVLTYDPVPFTAAGFDWWHAATQSARVVFRANDPLPLRDAARAGLGLAPLPHLLGDETPELLRVAGAGEGFVDLWLVTRSEQRRVPRIRAVVQRLGEVLHAHQQRLYAPP